MTTNAVDWTPEIENYIQSARRALRTAQLDLEDGDYTGSINRSYYAAFYAANALLATLGCSAANIPPSVPFSINALSNLASSK